MPHRSLNLQGHSRSSTWKHKLIIRDNAYQLDLKDSLHGEGKHEPKNLFQLGESMIFPGYFHVLAQFCRSSLHLELMIIGISSCPPYCILCGIALTGTLMTSMT
jgi:hypothetical protein